MTEPSDATAPPDSPPATPSTTLAAAPASTAPCHPSRARRVVESVFLSGTIFFALNQLGILLGGIGQLMAVGAVGIAVALAPRRVATAGRAVMAACGIASLAALFVVGYAPFTPRLVRGLYRSDPPERAPAVVVLGSVIHEDSGFGSQAQERTVHAFGLLRQGYAPRLVITRPRPPHRSPEQETARQMRELGLNYPADVVGPVSNTHDEAQAVAELMRSRGWDKVILVTHPWHMRRAAAAMEKAGARVICSPCNEGRHDLSALAGPNSRIAGFRYWIYESLGYWSYKRRGWV